MPKMNVNAFLQKDYENEPPSGPKKQTQSNPFRMGSKVAAVVDSGRQATRSPCGGIQY